MSFEKERAVLIPTVKDIEQVVKQPDKLLTIKENATVAEAAKKMSDNQVGCLVVFDMRGRFAGVLTERDMLAKVLTKKSLSPDNVPVKDIMTAETISCGMDTTIAEVEQLMAEHKIRHVPIVESGVPVGIISSRDVIAYRLRSNKAMKMAAEHLALLSTGLKSLDFDDVIALAINETPKSFEADWAVLCFTQKGPSAPMIYRKGCPLAEESLLKPKRIKELSQNGQVICGEIWADCEKLGAQAPRLVIPLSIHDQCSDRGDSNVETPLRDPSAVSSGPNCVLQGPQTHLFSVFGNSQDGNPVSRQGFLCMCRFNPSSIGSEKLRLYKASLLREVLSVNLTNANLYRSYQKARRDSEMDPLTGVGTRRVLEQVLRAECERALRYNHCFSVAIVDVDNFKEINDSAGHATGDKVLQQLTKIMRCNARTIDVLARYGGDEFVLLMPETKLNEATVLLERLRRRVKSISIPDVHLITVSCGVAEWSGSAAETGQDILKRADVALYEAKRCGRNRVVTSRSTTNVV